MKIDIPNRFVRVFILMFGIMVLRAYNSESKYQIGRITYTSPSSQAPKFWKKIRGKVQSLFGINKNKNEEVTSDKEPEKYKEPEVSKEELKPSQESEKPKQLDIRDKQPEELTDEELNTRLQELEAEEKRKKEEELEDELADQLAQKVLQEGLVESLSLEDQHFDYSNNTDGDIELDERYDDFKFEDGYEEGYY